VSANADLTWDDVEPGVSVGLTEAGRFARRGARRWWFSVVPALAIGAFFGMKTYATQNQHKATVLFTVPATKAFGKDATVLMSRGFSPAQKERGAFTEAVSYLNNVILNDDRLYRAIQGRPEFAELALKSPAEAAAGLRKQFKITQSAQEFIGEETDETADGIGSFVKLECTYDGYTKKTLALCLEVAAVILTADAELQMDAVSRTVGQLDYLNVIFRTALANVHDGIVAKSEELVELRGGAMGDLSEVPLRTTDQARLFMSIKDDLDELFLLGESVGSRYIGQTGKYVEFAQEVVLNDAGVPLKTSHVTMIDAGHNAPPAPFSVLFAAFLGFIIPFAFALPFSLFIVGAIDRRVYRPEDVEFFGMHSIGTVDLGLPHPLLLRLRAMIRKLRPVHG
jgi:hypothetical protein